MTCSSSTISRPDEAKAGNVSLSVRGAIGLAALAALCSCADPEDAKPAIERARVALAQGDGFAAEIALRNALEREGVPRDRLAALMGEAELAQGQFAEAREWLAPGEFDAASRAHGFHMLGRMEMLQGNLPAAGAAFDRAFMEGGEDPELWVDVAKLRYRGGEQLQAVEASQKAIELGPRNPVALHFRAQLIRDAFGNEAALPWYDQALELAPSNPEILADYAAALGESGKARRMLRAVRKLSRVSPGHPRLPYLQAVLAARGGNPDLSRSLLQRSGDLERNVPSALMLSAVIDMENGNHASAAQLLQLLSEDQPQNSLVQVLLARALSLGRNDQELVYRFAEKARRPSAPPYLVELVGRSYEALGDRQRAAWFLDRASQTRVSSLIVLQPQRSEFELGAERDGAAAILDLTRGALVAGSRANGARIAKSFAEKYPGSADALSLSGDAQLAAGNIGPAIELYEMAARVRRSWGLTKRMMLAYRASDQANRADALLAAEVRSNPSNVEAAVLLARRLIEQQQWERAATLLDHAIANGGYSDIEIVGLRSRVAAATGRDKRALRYALQANLLQPMNGIGPNLLASISRPTESQMDVSAIEYLRAKSADLAR